MPLTVDKALPYYVPEPQAHAVGSDSAPEIGLDVASLDNRGKPVVLNLSGSGFFAYSRVEVTWFTPQGKVYRRILVPTDNRGLMQVALLWTPVPGLGVAGNDGAWKISAIDQVSGQEADEQLNVSSDARTPPASAWAANGAPGAVEPPAVNAGTSGYLCRGHGAWSEVSLQGFRPGAKIDMAFYNGSGGRVLLVTDLRADAVGSLENILDFWKIRECHSVESFDYTVVADAPAVGQRAQTEIILTTK